MENSSGPVPSSIQQSFQMPIPWLDTFYLLLYTFSYDDRNLTVPYLTRMFTSRKHLVTDSTQSLVTLNVSLFAPPFSLCVLMNWQMSPFWLECRYLCTQKCNTVRYFLVTNLLGMTNGRNYTSLSIKMEISASLFRVVLSMITVIRQRSQPTAEFASNGRYHPSF